MNIFKKIYCRVYQIIFRILLPILPYREPVIFDTVLEIEKVLKENKYKNIFLVVDKFLKDSGITKELEDSLKEFNVIVFDGTKPNPTVENVYEAKELYLKEECECIIAFGGGSVIDCAKAVGACVVYPNKTLDQMKGILKVNRKLPLLFAIPTTAGTGSETTLAAVITDDKTKFKYPINSFPLIPAYAVLDPKVTYTLPKHLTSTTGMDALTHAVEAYIGRSTTKETRAKSLEAIKLIFENILIAYNDGTNYDARKNMLYASYLAGISFSKSYVGYVHAVAHSLGGEYNVPHGLANAILLPVVLEKYGSQAHKKLYKIAIHVGVATKDDSISIGANKFIDAVKKLNEKMNIPTKINSLLEEDIPMLAAHAEKEANPLYPVPKLFSKKELEEIYYVIK